jgi:hypothetical protein
MSDKREVDETGNTRRDLKKKERSFLRFNWISLRSIIVAANWLTPRSYRNFLNTLLDFNGIISSCIRTSSIQKALRCRTKKNI